MGLKKPTENDGGETSARYEKETPQDQTVESPDESGVSETVSEPVSTEATEAAPTQIVRKATQVGTTQSNFKQAMEDQGFGGLNLGFGSFPTIRLMNEGVFEDDDENEIGESFDCYVQSTRTKHLYKQAGNSESEIFYSYDGIELVKPSDAGASTVVQLKQEFKEDGFELEVKGYLECVVQMVGGEYDGEIFLLSIPPASCNKFSGVVATLQMKGKDIKETVITCCVGKKRKSRRSSSSYFPWAFKAQ